MNALERDASELLCLLRSLKNFFVPINRIPPEVLSLIPDYFHKHYADQVTIRLTHVCSGWREIFISRSSLWTCLDFKNVDKTRTYIHRSGHSPLDLSLEDRESRPYLDDAFSLVIPQIHRLRSLTVCANDSGPILKHFHSRAPLLQELHIQLPSHRQILDSNLFDGDFSSLRKLCLSGIKTQLPWNNMVNLRVFNLSYSLLRHVTVTRLLNFFESSPLLHTIALRGSIPDLFDAPPERIVVLPHLKILAITVEPERSILKHLHVPPGASVNVLAGFSGERSPLLDYLPETSSNLKNLFHIVKLNLSFDPESKCIQLVGPSGALRLVARREDEAPPSMILDHRILHSFDSSILSTIQRLAVANYVHHNPVKAQECPVFQTLLSTNHLRTLILSNCVHKPFISALNPQKNSSQHVLCPNLEEFVIYSASWGRTESLIKMAKGRAQRGAKLLSIVMIFLDASLPKEDISKLEEYVMNVKCVHRLQLPFWDDLSSEIESRFRKRLVSYPGW